MPYVCNICGKDLISFPSYNKHRQKDCSIKETLTCAKCDYKCSDAGLLVKHLLIHKKEKYKCDTCEFKTATKQSFSKHMREHKNAIKVQRLQKQIEDKQIRCNLCGFKARSKSGLKAHLRQNKLHSETHIFNEKSQKYECERCEFVTYYNVLLTVHCKEKHLDFVPYKCHLCEWSGYLKRRLLIHMTTHLRRKKLYQYNINVFCKAWELALQRNSLVYSTDKPYECDECSFKAASVYELLYHGKNHIPVVQQPTSKRHSKSKNIQREVEISVFKCEMCDFQSSQHGSLLGHMITHADDKCDTSHLELTSDVKPCNVILSNFEEKEMLSLSDTEIQTGNTYSKYDQFQQAHEDPSSQMSGCHIFSNLHRGAGPDIDDSLTLKKRLTPTSICFTNFENSDIKVEGDQENALNSNKNVTNFTDSENLVSKSTLWNYRENQIGVIKAELDVPSRCDDILGQENSMLQQGVYIKEECCSD